MNTKSNYNNVVSILWETFRIIKTRDVVHKGVLKTYNNETPKCEPSALVNTLQYYLL